MLVYYYFPPNDFMRRLLPKFRRLFFTRISIPKKDCHLEYFGGNGINTWNASEFSFHLQDRWLLRESSWRRASCSDIVNKNNTQQNCRIGRPDLYSSPLKYFHRLRNISRWSLIFSSGNLIFGYCHIAVPTSV